MKFNNKKTIVNGVTFDSQLEASVYKILLEREEQGEISGIETQVSYLLKDACKHCGAKAKRWKIDFSFIDNATSETVYCEAKGAESPKFRRDMKLWRAERPARLEIWKGKWQNPKLVEVIEKGD